MTNGISATDELSLRVSVATLVRVLFEHPGDGESMLALERQATVHQSKNGHVVEVKSQPFGGAIRILDANKMRHLIGDFRFDSERSRAEQDFRILIRPSDWPVLQEFCLQHLIHGDDSILETDPGRELVEEFVDALKINIKPEQYINIPIATLLEIKPSPTKNINAKGYPTVRVYRIFEASIIDFSLAYMMMKNSESLSHHSLCKLALEDVQRGGKGRANAILALPLNRITGIYQAISPNDRNAPVAFEKNRLDDTVAAILEGITVPKYLRL